MFNFTYVDRALVVPFTMYTGRYCQIFEIKKIYFCLILAIPIIYTYISMKLLVSNFMTNNRDQDYLHHYQDYYGNKISHKSQRFGEPIKLSKIWKFILLWNSPIDKSFDQIEEGNEIFTENKCRYDNCFVTTKKHIFSDIRRFHAIIFGPETTKMKPDSLPEQRSPYQKYIFFSKEPPQMNPACDEQFDDFFNWTWTYRLDSDIRWGLVIRDSKDTVVGPKKNMKWISTNISSVKNNNRNGNKDTKEVLPSKYRAAAWIASEEWNFNSRDKLISQLAVAFRDIDLELDIIGSHGKLCKENNDKSNCDNILELHYYFYIAFEKATSEDYVTPILLHALQRNIIPIVYGGADYTRFLPPDSYLNANALSPDSIAEKVSSLIKDLQKYVKYFEWKKHYSYHESNFRNDTNEYCQLCALLNGEQFEQTSIYKKFRKWWNSSECKSDSFYTDVDVSLMPV